MPRTKLDIAGYNISRFNGWVYGNMKEKKYDQKYLADYLGIPQPSISYRLSGKSEWKLREMFELEKLFGEPFYSTLSGNGGVYDTK